MSGLSSPAQYGAPVTPSDTANFSDGPTRALYVGSSGGNLVAIMNGTAITFKSVPAGILPIKCSRVNATGTTATDIVALW